MEHVRSITMLSRTTTAASLFLILVAGTAAAQTRACPSPKADAAEAAADRLLSWPAVADYYRQYRRCDDGGMAEASSEGIARLLVDHWSAVTDLGTATSKVPGLRSFVVAHINTTLDTADLKTIADKAKSSCPPGVARLCVVIQHAADSALTSP